MVARRDQGAVGNVSRGELGECRRGRLVTNSGHSTSTARGRGGHLAHACGAGPQVRSNSVVPRPRPQAPTPYAGLERTHLFNPWQRGFIPPRRSKETGGLRAGRGGVASGGRAQFTVGARRIIMVPPASTGQHRKWSVPTRPLATGANDDVVMWWALNGYQRVRSRRDDPWTYRVGAGTGAIMIEFTTHWR